MSREISCCLMTVCIVVSTSSSAFGQSPADSTDSGTMLWISDIHFNPYWGGEVLKLANKSQDGWRSHTEWTDIFSKMPANMTCSPSGQDSNSFLLQKVLSEASAQAAKQKPDVILLTGDFISHDFTDVYFNRSYLPLALTTVENHNSFVKETMAYVAMTVSNAFDGIPVVAALGNNDAYCGDYDIRGNSGYLASTRATFRKYFLTDLSEDFQTYGGCYATSLPGTKHKLVVLNSIPFLSRDKESKYPNLKYVKSSPNQLAACESLRTVELADEFEWFTQTIDSLSDSQKVWIACHVPPGVDCYGGDQYWARKVPYGASTGPFVGEFRNYYLRNRQHFGGVLAGHSHMAEFKLIRDGDGNGPPVSLVLMAPSIGRNHTNNSSFRMLTFNRETLAISEYVTHWLDGSKSPPAWGKPFAFTKTYGQPDVSPKSLAAVYAGMVDGATAPTGETMLSQYFDDYSTRNGGDNSKPEKNYQLALPRILGP